MRLVFWALLCGALTACAALPGVKDTITGDVNERATEGPLHRYRADLMISLEGKTFEGMAVTKLSGPLTFQITAPFKIKYFTVNSCAREDVVQDESWFAGKSISYTLNPVKKELDGLCPLYIKAFDQSGLAGWAYIAFRKDEDLPAHIDCNGEGWTFAGFTVCQSRAGLEQQMTFQQDIEFFETDPPCKPKQVDAKTFDLRSDAGFCEMTFYSKKRWHRLVFLNYEKPLIR